jgi:predicted O-linked N-acetylglucosamine transferase (SPINDLY family)
MLAWLKRSSDTGTSTREDPLAAGLAAMRSGDLQGACHLLATAVADSPTAQAHKALADALTDAGRPAEAERHYRLALDLAPGLGEAWNNLGLLLRAQGRTDEARAAFATAVRAAPALIAARVNLATALEEAGERQAAIASLEDTLQVAPGAVAVRNNLAAMLAAAGRPLAAERHYRSLVAADPGDALPWYNLGHALVAQGRAHAALAAFERACALAPSDASLASARLLCLNYDDALDPEEIAGAHRAWGAACAGQRDLPRTVDPDAVTGLRPLRVGYVSADFGFHVVSFFVAPVIACHDARAVQVFCYYTGGHEDAQCRNIQARGVHWRNLSQLDERAALEAIRADRLDVAVDLAGHTPGHRLGLFARGLAPVQATWLGYPNTTGLDAMDYRITDAQADPPGATDVLHSERLVRLPCPFLAYLPRPEAPPVAPLPALASGHVTFGCFNNVAKITDRALALWARVVAAVPGARLRLKGRGLDEPELARDLRARFSSAGGDPARLDLEGATADFAGHLARYGAVDIALDSAPYCGTTTTCEALWMGVPVVSLAGTSHVSRVGASLLAAAGHPEWCCHTPEDYVRTAASLAGDLHRLARVRAGLRQAVAASPLTDVTGFTRSLEAAYRDMVRETSAWC